MITASGIAGTANAQTPHPILTVAATIRAAPATQVPLSIRAGPPDTVPKGSFVRIRGLPPTVALSEGYSFAPGAWAVPVSGLPTLKITLPAAASGKSEISVTLVGPDGAILVEVKSSLVVASSSSAEQAEPGGGKPPPVSILRAGTPSPTPPAEAERIPAAVPPPAPVKMNPQQRERALRFVKRGDELLAQGGIAQARLLYQRAAEVGLAEAAMAMAATYDAEELSRLRVRGLQPDRAAALRWYERARELGAAGAEQKLRRLGAN